MLALRLIEHGDGGGDLHWVSKHMGGRTSQAMFTMYEEVVSLRFGESTFATPERTRSARLQGKIGYSRPYPFFYEQHMTYIYTVSIRSADCSADWKDFLMAHKRQVG